MGSVKALLEQNEYFRIGVSFTPILATRVLETEERNDDVSEDFKKALKTLGIEEKDTKSVSADVIRLYFLNVNQQLLKCTFSYSYFDKMKSKIEVASIEKIDAKDLANVDSIYVYDDEKTKPINISTIEEMVNFFGNYCDENMKAIYNKKSLVDEDIFKKYVR